MTNNWTNVFPEIERKKIVEAAKITLKNPEGKIALDYLIQKRKLSESVIEDFDIGYCPSDVDHQLAGRIITPIYDAYKNLIVLSTRHIDESRSDRFWHETFSKSRNVYGLCYAQRTMIKTGKLILVEGEMDVIALHSNGFTMTVGICGKALSLFQISLLSRYCSNFYLVFDGDNPGKNAIERALKMYKDNYLDCYGIKFIPVYLPDNLDPDDFIKQYGKKEFIKKLSEAKTEIEF